MKLLNALLIAFAFTTTGIANASTIANFDVIYANDYGYPSSSGATNVTGTAALDSSGILTVDMSVTYIFDSTFAYLTQERQYYGAWDGATLAPERGNASFLSCTPTLSPLCSHFTDNNGPFDPATTTITGALNVSGGNIISRYSNIYLNTGDIGIGIETLTFAPTAVPIPAAAWLFGSGLIGLAGVTRKRKTV